MTPRLVSRMLWLILPISIKKNISQNVQRGKWMGVFYHGAGWRGAPLPGNRGFETTG